MFVSSTESVVSAGIVFDSGKKNKLKFELNCSLLFLLPGCSFFNPFTLSLV